MRSAPTLLLVLGLLAMGISKVHARMIEPNIGFCNPPASTTDCSGQGEANRTSGGAMGTWDSGSNDTSGPWYLMAAIPDANYTYGTAATLDSPGFDSRSATSPSSLTTSSSTREGFTSDLRSPIPTDILDDWCKRPRFHEPHHPRQPDCDPVPEPGSLIMLSSGFMLLAGAIRRRLRG
jgi:hypothetical protein